MHNVIDNNNKKKKKKSWLGAGWGMNGQQPFARARRFEMCIYLRFLAKNRERISTLWWVLSRRARQFVCSFLFCVLLLSRHTENRTVGN